MTTERAHRPESRASIEQKYRAELANRVVQESIGSVGVHSSLDLSSEELGALAEARQNRDSMDGNRLPTDGGGWGEYGEAVVKADNAALKSGEKLPSLNVVSASGLVEKLHFVELPDGTVTVDYGFTAGDYLDSTRRPGNALIVSFTVGEDTAAELERAVESDPLYIRDVIKSQVLALGFSEERWRGEGGVPSMEPRFNRFNPKEIPEGAALEVSHYRKPAGSTAELIDQSSYSYSEASPITPPEHTPATPKPKDEAKPTPETVPDPAAASPEAEASATPEHTPAPSEKFAWDLVENGNYQPDLPVAVRDAEGEIHGLEAGWTVRTVNVTAAGDPVIMLVQLPAEGSADRRVLEKSVSEAEFIDMQEEFAENVRHTVETSFDADKVAELRDLYEARRAHHAKSGEANPGSRALEDMAMSINLLVSSADGDKSLNKDGHDLIASDLRYYLLKSLASAEAPEPSDGTAPEEGTTPEAETADDAETTEEADTPARRRSMAKRIADRFAQLQLAAYNVYPNMKRETSPEGMTDKERKHTGGNRLLVAGVVAVAAVGVMYARTKGFDFDMPGQEVTEAVTNTPVEVPAEIETIEHSADALTIDKGEGWYQTFEEMGIPKEEWNSLLDRVGDKLPDDVAYYDQEAGEWRMNMTEDGKLPEEVLDMIHDEWQGESNAEGAQAENAAVEPQSADGQTAEASGETTHAVSDQQSGSTTGATDSASGADSGQVANAASQAVEPQNTVEVKSASGAIDVAGSNYLRSEGGSIFIDRPMDSAALARELHISQDKATYLLQTLSMNPELSGAVAENAAGQLEIKPVKIANSNALLAIQTAMGR